MRDDELNNYIRKVQNGDLIAFRYIIDSNKRMAMSLALRIVKNREDAEDVVQDSFISAYNNISKFSLTVKFSTWFYKIVLNNALSFIRKSKPEFVNIDDNEEFLEIPDDSLSELGGDELSKVIADTLDELPELDSTILKLYYYEDFKIEEIAEILDIKYSNAKVILHRARNKFKMKLLDCYKNETKDFL
jgi:RNA polymerase sigma factor (sigma-70 family)